MLVRTVIKCIHWRLTTPASPPPQNVHGQGETLQGDEGGQVRWKADSCPEDSSLTFYPALFNCIFIDRDCLHNCQFPTINSLKIAQIQWKTEVTQRAWQTPDFVLFSSFQSLSQRFLIRDNQWFCMAGSDAGDGWGHVIGILNAMQGYMGTILPHQWYVLNY